MGSFFHSQWAWRRLGREQIQQVPVRRRVLSTTTSGILLFFSGVLARDLSNQEWLSRPGDG